MLLSLALVFLCGLLLGRLFQRLNLPSLLGMLITGIILGPYALGVLSPSLLNISMELRQIALIIVLARAGLSLNSSDLLKVGRPAILLCFVPACFEIAGMLILAPPLLGLTLLEAAILGTVIAAVSPAVVVPKMLKLMEEGFGSSGIPQLIMAGASVDDVFVIVLFTAFTALASGGAVTAAHFFAIPTSILLGIAAGGILGFLLSRLFATVHIRDSSKVLIIISLSFLLVALEHAMTGYIGFSGLLAVMGMGAVLRKKKSEVAIRLAYKFSKLWVGAEIWLFVLVGASVDLAYVGKAGLVSVFLIMGVLLFRMAGVWVCMVKTALSFKERLFCLFAYMPKATVQAAIGSIPLSMGLACGSLVLTVAVVAILFTAPLGAFIMDRSYRSLL